MEIGRGLGQPEYSPQKPLATKDHLWNNRGMSEHAFVIDLSGDGPEDQEDLEDARNDLRNDLLEVPGIAISYITEAGERGTRADIGTVASSVLLTIWSAHIVRDMWVPTLARVIKSYIDRRGRVVRIRKPDGTTVVMRNLTEEEIANVLDGIGEEMQTGESADR